MGCRPGRPPCGSPGRSRGVAGRVGTERSPGFGIERRAQKAARDLALRRGKIKVDNQDGTVTEFAHVQVDESFFGRWTPQMAWVLGVIVTDGHLCPGSKRFDVKTTSRSDSVTIAQAQPEILEKIAKLMRFTGKLYEKQEHEYASGKAGRIFTLDVRSERIYDDLLELGLHQAKSLTIQFPPVPDHLVRHFIRGCWDGDGSVYWAGRHIAASFVSGSEAFITELENRLHAAGLPRRTIHHDRSYYFRYHGEASALLYRYLYDGVPAGQYLARKRAIFAEYAERQRELFSLRSVGA